MITPEEYFPEKYFFTHYEKNTTLPLVVHPDSEQHLLDLASWANENQVHIAKAIHQFGAIVFSGYNLTKEEFCKTFTAITGEAPQPYKGPVPREELKDIGNNIYKSTAVAPAHALPPHLEVSVGRREDMPKYISFFCIEPPQEGTGQTTVTDVRAVTQKIEKQMPVLWEKMKTKNLVTNQSFDRTIKYFDKRRDIEDRFFSEITNL